MSGKAKKGRGEKLAIETLKSGIALKKMQEIIKAQGARILKSSDIPKAPFSAKVHAKKYGIVSRIDVRAMIKAARIAGAPSDKLAGIQMFIEKGKKAENGSIIFEIHAENAQKLALAKKFVLAEEPVEIK
ncbi:MAG: hypothetical protein PHD95_03440 [Candidatus ainarchaeum sp.]|nr:hypothetical protein [Candidatus ainarchaeum sp.]